MRESARAGAVQEDGRGRCACLLESELAIVAAIDTSRRAVMFAGIIVCIALLGMFALGVSFIYGVAVAAASRSRSSSPPR